MNIDVKLLAVQKQYLVELMLSDRTEKDEKEALEGVVALLDTLQDKLESTYGVLVNRAESVEASNRQGVEL